MCEVKECREFNLTSKHSVEGIEWDGATKEHHYVHVSFLIVERNFVASYAGYIRFIVKFLCEHFFSLAFSTKFT